jgi:hypothetical protein
MAIGSDGYIYAMRDGAIREAVAGMQKYCGSEWTAVHSPTLAATRKINRLRVAEHLALRRREKPRR